MIKFIKQPDLSGCGPTAIVNVGKIFEKKWTLKKYHQIRSRCKTDREGTSPEQVCKILKSLKFKVIYRTKSTWTEVAKSLKEGNPVVLGYNKISEKDFHKVNKDNRHLFKTISLVPIKKVKSLMKSRIFFQEKVLPDLIFIKRN